MSFWFVVAALVFVIAVIVILVRLSPGEPPEQRPNVPESFANDPRDLLEGLPDSVRLPLERMVVAHEKVSNSKKGTPLPAQATDLIGAAAPLALEVARLEDYMGRYDLRQVVIEAQSDVSRRVLLADLERMSLRHTALTEAITAAMLDLEAVHNAGLNAGVNTGVDAGRLESAVHRLRLL
jgi:hypothetical protein